MASAGLSRRARDRRRDGLLAVRRLAAPNLRLAGRKRPDREGGPVSREDSHRAETSRRSRR